jgi:hypothetical protein
MEAFLSNLPNILFVTFVLVLYFRLRAVGKKHGVG